MHGYATSRPITRAAIAASLRGNERRIPGGVRHRYVDRRRPSPASYDRGTTGHSSEVFGFMPWEARTEDQGTRDRRPTDRDNYVDGDVNSADVWIDSDNPGITRVSTGPTAASGARICSARCVRVGTTTTRWTSPIPNQIVEYRWRRRHDSFSRYAWEFPSEANPHRRSSLHGRDLVEADHHEGQAERRG